MIRDAAKATLVSSFAPLASSDARTLILGSMPGVASLEAVQYYAHPQNAFWAIINSLFGDPATDHKVQCYSAKKIILLENKLAVWDVLQECKREGSLDSRIDRRSVVCNNFAGFLAAHQHINTIAFNGKTAEQMFHKHAIHEIDSDRNVRFVSLPSSSPAMASLSRQQKAAAWRTALLIHNQ